MKQKFTVFRDDDNQEVKITEFAELHTDMYSFIIEKRFPQEAMEAALIQGQTALMSAFRSANFFPPAEVAEKIAQAVAGVFEPDGANALDIYVSDLDSVDENEEDDLDLLGNPEDDELDDESDELDGLLEDDNKIKLAKSPLKVDEDDSLDLEGDA